MYSGLFSTAASVLIYLGFGASPPSLRLNTEQKLRSCEKWADELHYQTFPAVFFQEENWPDWTGMERTLESVVRSRRALAALPPPFHPPVTIKKSLKTTSVAKPNASVNATLLEF